MPETEITEVKAASYDGTLIPMTVLHKKGIKLDGANPTLLEGYGAYGFSETAHFSPSAMVWMEQGGVLAMPMHVAAVFTVTTGTRPASKRPSPIPGKTVVPAPSI